MGKMRVAFVLLSLSSFLAVGCGADAAAPLPTLPPAENTADVFTPGNVFSPFSTTINAGGTVRFNIFGDAHNVIFKRIGGAPSDVNVVTRTIVSRTFLTAGTFSYDCTVHPGMSGQVVVR
jgi:plastocyanin